MKTHAIAIIVVMTTFISCSKSNNQLQQVHYPDEVLYNQPISELQKVFTGKWILRKNIFNAMGGGGTTIYPKDSVYFINFITNDSLTTNINIYSPNSNNVIGYKYSYHKIAGGVLASTDMSDQINVDSVFVLAHYVTVYGQTQINYDYVPIRIINDTLKIGDYPWSRRMLSTDYFTR